MSWRKLANWNTDALRYDSLWIVIELFSPPAVAPTQRGGSRGGGAAKLPFAELPRRLAGSAFAHASLSCSGLTRWIRHGTDSPSIAAE